MPKHVHLNRHCGRVLAAAVVAKRDQPPFAASAMDGYAVRHADIALAFGETSHDRHQCGWPWFQRHCQSRAAVRILTGAPLPKGADTVVIQENTEREGEVA